MRSLLPSTLCMGRITTIFQSFSALPNRLATWHTWAGKWTPLASVQSCGHFRSDFITTCSLLSLQSVFWQQGKLHSYFPPLNAPPVSDDIRVTGFNRSLKLSPSAKDILIAEEDTISICDASNNVRSLLRSGRMVCQSTLYVCQYIRI